MKAFGPFRLDPENECLRRGTSRISLTPKVFALLSCLVENAGRLVTQSELVERLWPDTYVQPEVLKTHVRDLRAILGDDARNPRFIETHHRRGYRFIAPLQLAEPAVSEAEVSKTKHIIVGQTKSLKTLLDIFRNVCLGKPALVFVTGEVGIGKTTLVHALAESAITMQPDARVLIGQCVEGHAIHEPYFPILQAFAQLLRPPIPQGVAEAFASYGPTWLARFPILAKQYHQELRKLDANEEPTHRMLREFWDACEAITKVMPLVIVLEDVHWCDSYTIDWLSAFGRGNWNARLMVVATYRPVELALSKSPLRLLKQRLLARRKCFELEVPPLTRHDVNLLLAQMAQTDSAPRDVCDLVFRNSEGNPLFIESVIEYLIAREIVCLEPGGWRILKTMDRAAIPIPETLRQLFESHIALSLTSDERSLLQAASVCGIGFAANIVASACNRGEEEVEEIFQQLAYNEHFIHSAGLITLPNGSRSPTYCFNHALYREILYRRIPISRRQRIHQAIGAFLNKTGAGDAEPIESWIASHIGCRNR